MEKQKLDDAQIVLEGAVAPAFFFLFNVLTRDIGTIDCAHVQWTIMSKHLARLYISLWKIAKGHFILIFIFLYYLAPFFLSFTFGVTLDDFFFF
jgi:hypothetical protein